MTRFAAVDCGTNSTRLLIVDEGGTALVREAIVTKLGEGVDASGRLADAAIERVTTALRHYRALIEEHQVDAVSAFATSAARDATNAEAFFTAATEALGVRPQLLSGEEEGAVTFAGATAGLAGGPFAVVDIGGGSTELAWGDGQRTVAHSMDIGCVRLRERILRADPVDPAELADALELTTEWLQEAALVVPVATPGTALVAVAGTATTLAAMDLGLTTYAPDAVHGHELTAEALEDLFRNLTAQSREERRADPTIPDDRVDTIVAGAVILLTVFRHFGFDRCRISERDNLDGAVSVLQDDR